MTALVRFLQQGIASRLMSNKSVPRVQQRWSVDHVSALGDIATQEVEERSRRLFHAIRLGPGRACPALRW